MKTIWKRNSVALVALIFLVTAGYGKNFLWKIDNGGSPSYLLGSIHMLKSHHYPLNPAIENAFSQCDVLGVEIDIAGVGAMGAAMALAQKAMLPDGETLEGNLSKTTYDLLKQKMGQSGMLALFQKMRPWVVAMMIVQLEMTKLGFDAAQGIDMHFLKKAAAANKQIVELEGMDLQMNLFDKLTKQENEMFLRSTLMDASQLQSQMNTIINAWMRGDTAALENYFTANVKKYPELENMYKKINDDRNIGMANKVLSYLQTGKKYFIVVGAAHMVGKMGLVQLLRNKGYTVTQL